MSSLEARHLNHLEAAIRAASGEQIVTIERLVGEVAYGEWTREGRLRHASWRGLRLDKDPADVHKEP